MQVNLDNLIQNSIATFMIMIGLITSEYVVEKRGSALVGTFGALVFLAGWYSLLSPQGYDAIVSGIFIPVVAFAGQVYFSHVLNKKRSIRRSLLPITILFWMVFAFSWVNYISTVADTRGSRVFLTAGLVTLATGMMGYFFVREKNWNELTGGIIPKLKLDLGIFNPFLPMVGFSWALIGLGSSLTSRTLP